MKLRSPAWALLAVLQPVLAGYPELDTPWDANLQWTATERLRGCSLDSRAVSFDWSATAPADVTMSTIGAAAVTGEHAAGFLEQLRAANLSVSARVGIAMFDACVADKRNPRSLPPALQSAIVTGPQAPRFLAARESPEGCSLESTYLLGDPVEMKFEVSASGARIRMHRAATMAAPAQPGLEVDFTALGGPGLRLEQGIDLALTADMASALRAELLSGETRILVASAGKKYREPFAVGSRVNDSAVAMFTACLAARGL